MSLAPVWEVWFEEEESSSLVLACTESQVCSAIVFLSGIHGVSSGREIGKTGRGNGVEATCLGSSIVPSALA